MAELHFNSTHYEGPVLEGYRSEVDEEDLEHILIASREHIYSHPIQTLVQEYINNGKDANRSAGKPDRAMDITVPTYDNMEFVVRDYGVGLSKDEIIQVYRKIGKSTKRKDNKLAGKYGVGAKIGFVYTDAFLITSWKDGRKVECLAHKANSQIGDYTFLSDMETTESNGVQISIKLVNPSHVTQFRSAIQRMFFLWPEKPQFNVDFVWPAVEYEDPCVKVLSKTYGQDIKTTAAFTDQFIDAKSLWLNVDGTPYKVSDTIAKRCGIDLSFYHRAVYINATLSDVDIPMNREELTTNSKLEHFLRNCLQKIEAAKQEVLNKIFNKDDYTSILDIKKYIMEHMTSFKIGKVEVYAKIIDRKVTYEDGWFYLEPKEEDLFTHFFAHSPDNYRENKTKFSADNIFCEKVSTYSTNKVKRHQHNNRTRNPIYSIWTVPLGTKFPEDIWKFCNLRDYYDMFPKKVKEVVAAEKAVNDVVYYDRHLRREACKRTTFARRYEIEKPLFYSLFENNHSKESILYTRGDLYHFDLKEKGNLIGLIPRNLKILKAWGYNLICIDGEYTFSKKVYIELKRSLFNDIIGHRDNLEITSTDDQDIRYIKACRKEGRKGGNDLDCDNSSLPEHLKAFVAKEKEKIVSARYRIDKRYPFIKHLSYSELRGVDKWMSSYLIPLLLSNPQMEQNKLEKPTTDLN